MYFPFLNRLFIPFNHNLPHIFINKLTARNYKRAKDNLFFLDKKGFPAKNLNEKVYTFRFCMIIRFLIGGKLIDNAENHDDLFPDSHSLFQLLHAFFPAFLLFSILTVESLVLEK